MMTLKNFAYSLKFSKNFLLSKLTEFDNAITNVKILCLVLFNVLLLL